MDEPLASVDESLHTARSAELARRITSNLRSVMHAPDETLELCVLSLFSEGHLIIEDLPGVGKTTLAKALARSVDLSFSRIQFTPDLLPSDVTGVNVYNQRNQEFEFRPGPVFANVLLVDEINRAMPKTQSALLEAMAERQITVDGTTRPLPAPFFLIATENPIEQEGTFPLPEAQLDRFFLRSSLGYPDEDEELRIVQDQRGGHPLDALRPVVTIAEVLDLQEAVDDVYVDPIVQRWIVALIRATRAVEFVSLGASVRGSLALERATRAWALAHGRDHAEPEDVEKLFGAVVTHRVLLAPEFLSDTDIDADEIGRRVWQRCLELAPRPAPQWDGARGSTASPRGG